MSSADGMSDSISSRGASATISQHELAGGTCKRASQIQPIRKSSSQAGRGNGSASGVSGPTVNSDEKLRNRLSTPDISTRSSASGTKSAFDFNPQLEFVEREKQRSLLFEEDDPEYDAVLGSKYYRQQPGRKHDTATRMDVETPEARLVTRPDRAYWAKPAYELHPLPRDWTEAYGVVSQLVSEYEVTDGRCSLHGRFHYDDRMLDWVQQYEDHMTKTQDASTYWRSLTYDQMHRRWLPMMLHFILEEPKHVQSLLHTLLLHYEAPIPLVISVLNLIARVEWVHRRADQIARAQFGHRQTLKTKHDSKNFWEALMVVIRADDDISSLNQEVIRLALHSLPETELADALILLAEHRIELTIGTRLAMVRRFASCMDLDGALHQLAISLSDGADPSEYLFRTTVAKLIRCAGSNNREGPKVLALVARLKEMNIKLTIPAWNCLILNAINARRPDTAWQLFRNLARYDQAPDDYTYCIMLKLSRDNGDNAAYRDLYFRLNPENKSQLSSALITELLQCWDTFGRRDGFDVVLRFYERHCDIQPLKDLGILPNDYESAFAGWYSTARPLPRAEALVVILLKYMRQSQRVRPVYRLYLKFLEQLNKGNPLIVHLACSDHIWNGFFKAFSGATTFTRERVSITGEIDPLHWTEMLKTMTRIPPSGAIDPVTGQSLEQLRPSQVTWNILLNAHARAGDVEGVDRIKADMQSRGLELGVEGYNSLLGGFARFQHVGLVSTVLQQMRAAEVPANEHTAQALAHLDDKDGLLYAMRALESGPLTVRLSRALRRASQQIDGRTYAQSSARQRGRVFQMKAAMLDRQLRHWMVVRKRAPVVRLVPGASKVHGQEDMSRGKERSELNSLLRMLHTGKPVHVDQAVKMPAAGWADASGRMLFESNDKADLIRPGSPQSPSALDQDVPATAMNAVSEDSLFEPEDDDLHSMQSNAVQSDIDGWNLYNEVLESDEAKEASRAPQDADRDGVQHEEERESGRRRLD